MKRNRSYLDKEAGNKTKLNISQLIAILENSFDGLYVTDGNAVTLWMNQSYQVISGLKPEEVLGKSMFELVDEQTIDQSGTILALKQRSPITLDQTFKTGMRAVITSTPIFDEKENIVLVNTNVRDVSELYNLRESLKKNKKLTKKYEQEISLIRKQLADEGSMIAEDQESLEVLRIASKVSKMDTVVLITGETGVGKERLASYIHFHSKRSKKAYIKVNCAAIVESLAESELFGYEKGAFTGAKSEGKPGYFEFADGGTVFLDEVGELSLSIQTKLLRVLQEKEIVRVGGNKEIKVDVRIICATNRDLKKEVEKGNFREDLFYRLSVFPIHLPPLRKRKNDITAIAKDTISRLNKKYASQKFLAPRALGLLTLYEWPGNVRELNNVLERAFVLSEGNEITPNVMWFMNLRENNVSTSVGRIDLKKKLEEIEKHYILEALYKTNGLRKAARFLSMDPATLLRRCKKYRIKVNKTKNK